MINVKNTVLETERYRYLYVSSTAVHCAVLGVNKFINYKDTRQTEPSHI